jgi:hypothetical protein
MDDYIARTPAFRDAEGDPVYLHLQQNARNAYVSWDSEIYIVNAASSHVWDDFAAGDPQFWRAAKQ